MIIKIKYGQKKALLTNEKDHSQNRQEKNFHIKTDNKPICRVLSREKRPLYYSSCSASRVKRGSGR